MVVALGDEAVDKVGPWLVTKGATFPALIDQRSRAEWNDPPGGNHALDIIVGRDGAVHTIDNGLATDVVVPIVDMLLAQ